MQAEAVIDREILREKVAGLIRNLGGEKRRELEEEEWRLDILERLNNHIYNVVRGELGVSIAEDILWWSSFDDRLQDLALLKLRGNALEMQTSKWVWRNLYLGMLLTAVYYVRPESIPVNSRVKEDLRYLKYPDMRDTPETYTKVASKIINDVDGFTKPLTGNMASWIRRLKKKMIAISRKRDAAAAFVAEMLAKHLDRKAMPHLLARKVASDALESYAGIAERGARIAVLGNLGVGKSTLTYHVLYGALRILRVPDPLAMEAARALMTNKPTVHLLLLYAATNPEARGPDFRLPALVLDDVATEVSKYWQYEDKQERELTIKLSRIVKVTREGLGNVFFLSDKKDNLPKGIRDSLDYEVIGAPYMIDSGFVSTTLWIVNYIHPKVIPSPGTYQRARSEIMELRRIYVVLGTASPPVYMPAPVYHELKTEKLSVRARLVAETVRRQAEKEEEV